MFRKKLKIFNKAKFSKADFPLRLINSVVAQFNNSKYSNNEKNRTA